MVTFILIALNQSSSNAVANSMTPSNMNTPSDSITPTSITTVQENSSSTVMNSTTTSTAMVTELSVATMGTSTVSDIQNGEVIIVSSPMHVASMYMCSLLETA